MLAFKLLSVLSLAAGVFAQGQFGQPENSAVVLAALQAADQQTISSGQAAAQYVPRRPRLEQALVLQNQLLLGQWQNVTYQAQSSLGFYTDAGAQAIINYINRTLFPDTRAANRIYTNKRDVFVQGNFIGFINPGLLKLRQAVDAASAAVQSKTRANQLTAITVAFTQIEQSYANAQQIQQFGSL